MCIERLLAGCWGGISLYGRGDGVHRYITQRYHDQTYKLSTRFRDPTPYAVYGGSPTICV